MATGLILRLSNPQCRDASVVGSKAARLAALLAAGYRIAPGFCVPYLVYRRQLFSRAPETVRQLIGSDRFREARELICQLPIQQDAAALMVSEFRLLRRRYPAGVVVRSSATAEDLDAHSFAGLYVTTAGVADELQLFDAVRTCWASFWSDEAVAYRRRAGLDGPEQGMGVLVQGMVAPRVGGVLFTADPRESAGRYGVVELLPRDVEGIVSGSRRATRLLFDRQTLALTGHEADLASYGDLVR